jgi:hypothetical protein
LKLLAIFSKGEITFQSIYLNSPIDKEKLFGAALPLETLKLNALKMAQKLNNSFTNVS